MLRYLLDFSILHCKQSSFIDFANVPLLFLGYSGKVLNHASTIQQKKLINLLKDKKSHVPEKLFFDFSIYVSSEAKTFLLKGF